MLAGQFDDLPTVPLDEQGCVGEATLDNGRSIVAAGLQATAISQQSVLEAAAEDRELAAATEQWSRCMAEAGYRYADHEQVMDEIRTRYQEIVTPLSALAFDLDAQAVGQILRGDDTTSVPEFSFEALADLQRFEVEVATQDLACFEAHVRAVLDPTLQAGEAQAIEENRFVLESVRDVLQSE